MKAKEVEEKIGKENMWKFRVWMRCQTVGFKEGEADYYSHDVDAFVAKLKTGYDRQKSAEWD